MKTVLFAYHDIGCAAIRTLHEMGEEICAVFTHEDDPKENVWFGSVKKCAQELKIPHYTPENPNQEEWVEKIRGMKPDILFSFYYRKLLSEEILALPPKGAFNLHGSLLPKFRGRAPINWAILKGEKETGITLHCMVKKADAGDVVAQKRVAISEEDTAHTVFKNLAPLTREILLETVPLLRNGAAARRPQNEDEATKFGGRKPEDGKIDWSRPPHEIHNLVRAVTHPYPGAFTFLKGNKLFVWKTKMTTDKTNLSSPKYPGKIVSLDPLLVLCGGGLLDMEKVQADKGPELSGT
ncbi:MAG: formyltransferase, partial [Elusimicrobia bacterium]|nr:formyltransferase [Elusimicrobiota bacterium]